MSFTQSNFLGGEWSPMMAGRIDDPEYRTALAKSYNMLPTEEGAIIRRGGTRLAGPSNRGFYARTLSWDIAAYSTYDLEISTDNSSGSWVRFWHGAQPVTDGQASITAISTADPCEITLDGVVNWSTGDIVVVTATPGTLTGTVEWAAILNRQLVITKIDTTHFTLADALDEAGIDGSKFPVSLPTLAVARIARYGLPYTTNSQVAAVQGLPLAIPGTPDNGNVTTQSFLLMSTGVETYQVTLTTAPSTGAWPVFTVAAFAFPAGPYQASDNIGGDKQGFLAEATSPASFYAQYQQWVSGDSYSPGALVTSPSGASGIDYLCILAVSGSTAPASDPTHWTAQTAGGQVNDGAGFVASDVGRPIRLYSQPMAWNSGTTYTSGEVVFWSNQGYIALANATTNLNLQPDANPASWAAAPQFLVWIDAVIYEVISANHVEINFYPDLASDQPVVVPTIQNTGQISLFVMGLYNNHDGIWPGAGTWQAGRLWLSGAIPNRFDASESGAGTFRPTDANGNVLANAAFNYNLNSVKNNLILWMLPDQQGVLMGTQAEEWLVNSNSTASGITPSTVDANKVTEFGSYGQAIRSGMTVTFINRYRRRIFEYLPDVFSGRMSGLALNARAKHLTTTGAVRLAYVENINPVIWAVCGNGTLVGCTYRRVSRFVQEPPKFFAWHGHALNNSSYKITDLSQGIDPYGSLDSITLISTDGTSYFRQVLQPIFDEDDDLSAAWCLDGAYTGTDALQPNGAPLIHFGGILGTEDGTNMYFSGLWYMTGYVNAWIAGLNMGSFEVINGAITVPYGSDPNGIGTRGFMQGQLQDGVTGNSMTVQNLGAGYLPVVVGSGFVSVVTLLRPDVQNQAQTQHGPAAGEIRRAHEAAALVRYGVNNSVNVSVDGNNGYPMVFRRYLQGPPTGITELFTGVWQDTIIADASLDGQVTFTVSGPAPFALNNVSVYSDTAEK